MTEDEIMKYVHLDSEVGLAFVTEFRVSRASDLYILTILPRPENTMENNI